MFRAAKKLLHGGEMAETTIDVSRMSYNQLLELAQRRITSYNVCYTKLLRDLAMVRTGRAQSSLVENISVEAYPGTWMKLPEVASISAPDTHMLLIKPWDQSVLKKIETAIAAENIGVNPVSYNFV